MHEITFGSDGRDRGRPTGWSKQDQVVVLRVSVEPGDPQRLCSHPTLNAHLPPGGSNRLLRRDRHTLLSVVLRHSDFLHSSSQVELRNQLTVDTDIDLDIAVGSANVESVEWPVWRK
jgi:hypothetical protein